MLTISRFNRLWVAISSFAIGNVYPEMLPIAVPHVDRHDSRLPHTGPAECMLKRETLGQVNHILYTNAPFKQWICCILFHFWHCDFYQYAGNEKKKNKAFVLLWTGGVSIMLYIAILSAFFYISHCKCGTRLDHINRYLLAVSVSCTTHLYWFCMLPSKLTKGRRNSYKMYYVYNLIPST